MKGHIRAKGRCEHCAGPWAVDTLLCPCGRRPSRGIYIDLSYGKRPARRAKIYGDRRGQRFGALEYAQSTLGRIRSEIDDGTFDAQNYLPREQREMLWPNQCARFQARQEARFRRGEISAATLRHYAVHLRLYLREAPMLRSRDIREIRGSHLQEFQDWLDGKSLSATSKANIIGVLRLLFSQAHALEDIEKKPRIPTAHRPVPEHYRPRDEEREAILEAVPARHRPVFWFLFEEPLREIEACRLRRTFLHRQDPEPWVEIPKHIRKAGPSYALPLTARALEAVDASPVRGLYLFAHGNGEPYTPDQLRKIWNYARRRAGVSRPTLYEATRHFIATRAANAGRDIGEIAAMLGNTIEMVSRHYVTYRPESLRDALSGAPKKAAPKRPRRVKGGSGPKSRRGNDSPENFP